MKVLFWLEPHFELARPGMMQTWLSWFDRIGLALTHTMSGADYRIVCLDSPTARTLSDSPCERQILMSHKELLVGWRLMGNAFMQLELDSVPSDVCSELLLTLRGRLAGFEPDVVFLLNQQPWLHRGFSNALFVNIELSWTSRPPFPTFWLLDITGAGKGRLLKEYTEEVLDAEPLAASESFVSHVRSIASNYLTDSTAEGFVESLREEYSAVTLLPIGIFDHFDGETSFFSALDKFLGEQNGEAVFILTQHPMWQLLNSEQVSYLVGNYPYVRDGGEIGSQYLLPLVDQVIGDFSTVATQALFFDTQVVSVRRELNGVPIDIPLLNPLVDILANATVEERDKILCWLLAHYAIPGVRLFDGVWLGDFLNRAIEAVQSGKPWCAYKKLTASINDWAEPEWRDVPIKGVCDSEARLYFSETVLGMPQGFTETRSVATLYPVSKLRQTLRLRLPEDVGLVARIRLDPANNLVALCLHEIALIAPDESELWRWGGDDSSFINIGGLTIRAEGEELILVSLNDDPHFDLVLPDEVLAQLGPNVSFVFKITPLPLQDVVPDVLAQDDRLIVDLRSKLKKASISNFGFPEAVIASQANFSRSIEDVAALLKDSLVRRDQTIADQHNQLSQMRDDLLRAEAQLDLLKDVMLGGREEDRL